MSEARSVNRSTKEPSRARSRRGRRATAPVQLSLDLARRRNPDDKRGGARLNAGRPKSQDSGVPHRVRPALSRHHPVHVTLRIGKDARDLRANRVFKAIKRALTGAKDQFGFRLNQYSVQSGHIHLIAEAKDRRALTRGMMGLTIRVALAVNRVHGRKGRVFGDRYHARQLRTPLEVRRALLYVLRNDRHHRTAAAWSPPPWHLDIFSSALEFDGWRHDELYDIAFREAARSRGQPPPTSGLEPSVTLPRSHLLRVLWRQRHGALSLDEMPIPS